MVILVKIVTSLLLAFIIVLLLGSVISDEQSSDVALLYINNKIEKEGHLHQGGIPAKLVIEDSDFKKNGRASLSLTINEQDFHVDYPDRNRQSTILIELLAGTPVELKESLKAYWVHPLPKSLLKCDLDKVPDGMSQQDCDTVEKLLDKPLAALCVPHDNGKPRCVAVEGR